MPTYVCTSLDGRLTAEQKRAIAREITNIHSEVTGAPTYFAQVIFNELKPGNWFMGGLQLRHDHIFVHGHIRAGRAADDKARMDHRLYAEVSETAMRSANRLGGVQLALAKACVGVIGKADNAKHRCDKHCCELRQCRHLVGGVKLLQMRRDHNEGKRRDREDSEVLPTATDPN